MKIVMIGQFPPHIGGVGVHIYTLAKKLIEKNHEVYVITYPHKDIEDLTVKDNEGKEIGKIHVIGTGGLNIPGLRGLLFLINGKKALKKLLKEEDIDIIHGHYLFPPGYVGVSLKNENIKRYLTCHGSDILDLYKNHFYIRPIIKTVLKKADKIIAVSNAVKEEIVKINIENIDKKTEVYYNSVDTVKFHPNEDYTFKKELKRTYAKEFNEDYPLLLYVGSIIKKKNITTLLEAKKLLPYKTNLIIVGSGNQLNKLKEKVSNEKIEDVYFTGSRRDVENIIPSCDMLILPSLIESFGLVLIEALACGKPVIGSNINGIKEVINEDVGLLFNPNNENELANCINKIIKDKELKNKFIKNSRNRALEFRKVNIPYDEID